MALLSGSLVRSSERQWLGVRVTAGSLALEHPTACFRCTGLVLVGELLVCTSGRLQPAPVEADSVQLPSLLAGASLVAWLAVVCSEASPHALDVCLDVSGVALGSPSGGARTTLRVPVAEPVTVTTCSQHLPTGAALQLLLMSRLPSPAIIRTVALNSPCTAVPLALPALLRPGGTLAALFLLRPSAQREATLTLEYELQEPVGEDSPPPAGLQVTTFRVPLPPPLGVRVTATHAPRLGCVGEGLHFRWCVKPEVLEPLRWEVSAAPADWLLLSPQAGPLAGGAEAAVEACLVPLRAGCAAPPVLLLHSADGVVGGGELAPLAAPVRVLPPRWTA